MRLLIASNDASLAETLDLRLSAEGFAVDTIDTAEDALEDLRIVDFDLVVIDDDLADTIGAALLRKMRARQIKTPASMLTTRTDAVWRTKLLNDGADDVIVRPFDWPEVLARVHAVVRRSRGQASQMVKVGPVVLDLDRKQIVIAGAAVHVTPQEYRMAEALALRAGVTLTKQNLMDALYGGRDEPEVKIIGVFICKLRNKLKAAGAADVIQTIWGRGYCMREPEAVAS